MLAHEDKILSVCRSTSGRLFPVPVWFAGTCAPEQFDRLILGNSFRNCIAMCLLQLCSDTLVHILCAVLSRGIAECLDLIYTHTEDKRDFNIYKVIYVV